MTLVLGVGIGLTIVLSRSLRETPATPIHIPEHARDENTDLQTIAESALAGREGAVVVDVGMNQVTTAEEVKRVFADNEQTKRLEELEKRGYTRIGDVEPRSVLERAAWFTPVPGGVGLLTIAMLMKNTLKAAEMRRG